MGVGRGGRNPGRGIGARVLAGQAMMVVALALPSAAAVQSGPAQWHTGSIAPGGHRIGSCSQLAPATTIVNPSGLPLPRYVSLKSSRVNVRKGPGPDYPIAWVFQRAGLPVEVIKEFELWRQIRDSEGSTGWVLHSLLSGRRTALLAPWDAAPGEAEINPAVAINIHQLASDTSAIVAVAEPGALADVVSCDKVWCRVRIGDEDGYIAQTKLWGVYPDETVK